MTTKEQLDDIEEVVKACLSYTKTLRTDAIGQNRGYKSVIESNWTKIEEILFKTDILLPEPNIFNTLPNKKNMLIPPKTRTFTNAKKKPNK